MFITGILWSYSESEEKVHKHMFAPNVQFMVKQFEVFFERVEIISYPTSRRSALVATGKRTGAAG